MTQTLEFDIAIIGGGPAGLMAEGTCARDGVCVHVIEAKPSLARKFLLAGKSGLNISHSEPLDIFLSRYGEAHHFLTPFIQNFPPDSIKQWMEGLGEEVFIFCLVKNRFSASFGP